MLLILLSGCTLFDNEEDYQDFLQSMSIDEGMDFFFYCNVDVNQPKKTEQYKNLLIYVHGGALDSELHFGYANRGIFKTGRTFNTIVLAPQFQMSNTQNNYYWTQFSWKDGKKSINAVPKMSSFAILDSLIIGNVLKNYKQIETVVIAGHSAGGQFVYRYAVLSQLPDLISQEVYYLPMNPGTVTYMGPERWNKSKSRFETPLNAASCPSYNDWIHGLSNISTNEYNRNITASEIREVFPWRNLTIAIGTEDTKYNELDMKCEDMYLGLHRYERATNMFNYIKTYYPSTLHQKIEVQGVAHHGDYMINSPEIVDFLSEVLK